MFASEATRTAIKNTFIWVVFAPSIVTALGLIFAVLSERIRVGHGVQGDHLHAHGGVLPVGGRHVAADLRGGSAARARERGRPRRRRDRAAAGRDRGRSALRRGSAATGGRRSRDEPDARHGRHRRARAGGDPAGPDPAGGNHGGRAGRGSERHRGDGVGGLHDRRRWEGRRHRPDRARPAGCRSRGGAGRCGRGHGHDGARWTVPHLGSGAGRLPTPLAPGELPSSPSRGSPGWGQPS